MNVHQPANKRIGLYFGSFNPIHIGHLIIADSIFQSAILDEIWFVISPHNPLKSKDELLPENRRLQMVELAIQNNPVFHACDVEFQLPQPSYTIQTLSYLSEKYPDSQFELIMGEDNLECFHLWKDYEHILSHYTIHAYPRLNSSNSIFRSHPNVHLVDLPLLDISSTYIRNAIKNGKSKWYFLPNPVAEYISENKLYKI